RSRRTPRRSSSTLARLWPDLAMAGPAAPLGRHKECERSMGAAALGEVGPDLEQGLDEPLAVGVAEAGERLLPLLLAERPHAFEHRRHLGGGVEPAGAAGAPRGGRRPPPRRPPPD